MTDTPLRLDGWKAIAAHFRRNRSTVMRWAEKGDFPVRHVAGRKGASVWAYAHELDAWLAGSAASLDASPADSAVAPMVGEAIDTPLAFQRANIRLILVTVCALLALAGVVGGIALWRRPAAPSPSAFSLPADPATADLYLQARDDWSTRTPTGLHKAMVEYAAVTSRDPKYAPAYVGLADAYLLAREFTPTPAAEAFPKAEAAAKAALAIDPDSADANRALGFIDYWARSDANAARAHFERALRLNPNSAQTHFWYGNILNDMGAREEGLRQMRAARLLEPGSRAIQADYAFMLWQRGPGDPGKAELEALAENGPPFGSPHRYLTYIALANGDVATYLIQVEKLAAIEGGADLTRRVATERAAFERGGDAGLYEMLLRREPAVAASNARATEWPATAASLLGRRRDLLDIIARGERAGEHWRSWREDQQRFMRWQGDPVVAAALVRVGARPPGPGPG